jgi:hypothetical protein
MVKLYFGLAFLNDDGFMDFQDHLFRTYCTVADCRTQAANNVRLQFLKEYGIEPERVCVREIDEVDGYKVLLQPLAE